MIYNSALLFLLFLGLVITQEEDYNTNAINISDAAISKNEKLFQDYKGKIIEKIINNIGTCPTEFLAFREIQSLDDPSNFFCNSYETKLQNLPSFGKADKTPWSSTYWPIKIGGLSQRYNKNKSVGDTYIESINSYHQPADHLRYSKTSDFPDMVNNVYSPAEKYDLLVGDLEYTLTNSAKSEGKYMEKDADGDVAEWMGKCHGWAPASLNEPRPTKSVKITAADGETIITFYPEDIKALIINYWAEARYTTKFLGSRCDYKDSSKIPKDRDTGLYEEYSCFAVNPATLTLTIANQLGIRKKGLIYDPDSNGQIWNQPVFGYKMSFFNPISNLSGEYHRVKVSMLEISENSSKFMNFFKRKSGPHSKYAIGVKMNIQFVFENQPQPGMKSMPDNIQNRDYTYILELDENENIVGGEWTTNSHPIFIWNPSEKETPFGYGDDIVRTFNGSIESLKSLTNTAKTVSKKNTVLGAIVKYLTEQSK